MTKGDGTVPVRSFATGHPLTHPCAAKPCRYGKSMLAKPLPRILTALCAALLLVSATPQRPRRVVSINMCTDQLVVLLADRDQIAGLGPNAGKRELSAVADKIAGLPIFS